MEHLTHLREYFRLDLAYKGTTMDFNDWKMIIEITPKQKDRCDCAVFMLLFAFCLASKKGFEFIQKDILYYRECMALELIRGELIDDSTRS
jgi:Ulp1 family protease